MRYHSSPTRSRFWRDKGKVISKLEQELLEMANQCFFKGRQQMADTLTEMYRYGKLSL